MPVRHRSIRRRDNVATLTEEQTRTLLYGRGFFPEPAFDEGLEGARAAWSIHGDRLTEEFIEKYPGMRPWGWWIFVHRSERPATGTFWTDEQIKEYRDSTHGFWHTHVHDGKTLESLQEDETDYLDRHGLIGFAERQAIGAQDEN